MRMFRKVLQTVLSLGIFYLLLMNSDEVVSLFYYKNEYVSLFPVVVFAFIVLSIIAPKKWAMSINRFKEANILEKVSPLIFSLGMIWLFSFLTQTYAIVIVSSFFAGNTIAYIGWLISYLITPKIFKFLKLKVEAK